MEHTKSARRLVYVLNPAAGKGKYLPDARRAAEEAHADIVHLTERQGECIDFIANTCLTDPDTHFVVYGGDGTAGEAATGIMRAGAGSRAILTVVPCGSGNDFARGMAEFPPPDGEDARLIDLIAVNGRYVINVLNMGFDCDVVAESERLRRARQLPNSLSYIAGVAATLSKKESFHAAVQLSGVQTDGSSELHDEEMEGDFLLTAAANFPYYGGGFKAAPASDPSDGFMDVLLVKDISIPRFLSLVASYRKGTHVNAETAHPYPPFQDILTYRRCRTMRLEGVKRICLDGEIVPATGVHADVVPKAIRCVSLKPKKV